MLLAVLKKDRRTDSSYDMRIVRTMTSRGREVGKETEAGSKIRYTSRNPPTPKHLKYFKMPFKMNFQAYMKVGKIL